MWNIGKAVPREKVTALNTHIRKYLKSINLSFHLKKLESNIISKHPVIIKVRADIN